MAGKFTDSPRAVRWPSPRVVEWLRARITASGGDPAEVPETSFKLLPLATVREMTGLSTSSIYRMMAAGEFPRAVPVDRASVRAA